MKLSRFYLLTLILLTEKDATFWLRHHIIANLIRKACAKLYPNRPRFVQDVTKTFWCVFRLTVLTAVHLQNVNAKFHKVGYRHYSGEAENVYISVYDTFTQDNMYQIFVTIGQVCRLDVKDILVCFFGSQCQYCCCYDDNYYHHDYHHNFSILILLAYPVHLRLSNYCAI